MADKREQEEIKVTDRRRFSAEGDIISPGGATQEPEPPREEPPSSKPSVEEPPANKPPVQEPGEEEMPPPPTDAEQQASRDAFRDAGTKLDAALDSALGDKHRPEAMKVNFETFIAEIYMAAMLQLGMLHEQGQQPRVDLVGARHSIDTLVMIEEKTRGNLTDTEKSILQDCLFRLRMAFVEITNLLTHPPAPGAAGPGKK